MPKVSNYGLSIIIPLTITLSLVFLYKEYDVLAEFVELEYINFKSRSYQRIDRKMGMEKLIAHAGGGVNGYTYTNSLEALNLSYEKGFRFMEIDLEWTSDNHLVLLHDWDRGMPTLFNARPGVHTLNEFKKLKMIGGLTQMTLESLVGWLEKHPDAFIVTDIKQNPVDALKLISQKYPEMVGRTVAQIYRFREYYEVRDLGFDKIILTLYMKNYNDGSVLEFLRNHQVLAVAMPVARAKTALPVKLKSMGTFVYVHTVNEDELKNILRTNGVYGFYTDFLKSDKNHH